MALRAVAPPSRQWGAFGLSANQTTGLTVNSPIRFDTVTAGTLTLSASTITLPAGRVFRLLSGLAFNFSAASGSVQTVWFNLTSGLAVGTSARHLPGTNTAMSSAQPASQAIIDTTGGAATVQLRISAATSPSAVVAAFSFAEVMEIA